MKSRVESYFKEKFGAEEVLVSASGRANMIGEHTDYNDGFVFPFAIQQRIFFAAKKAKTTRLEAIDINEYLEISDPIPTKGWQRLYYSLIDVLSKKDFVIGPIQMVFGGNLPIGSGISSSSALCCGWLEVLDSLFSLNLSKIDKVYIASEAEHGLGVRGGKMDQYAIINGEENMALLLDCKSLTHQVYSIPHDWNWVLLNSGKTHDLVNTEYNDRRGTCERAVFTVNNRLGTQYTSLRDMTLENLGVISDEPTLYQMASYVIEENLRVHNFAKGLEEQSIEVCKKALLEGHHGLSHKYKVSIPEIDDLVDFGRDLENIYGSRLMGGGFGGCTINLVTGDYHQDIKNIQSRFKLKYGYEPKAIEVKPSMGIVRY